VHSRPGAIGPLLTKWIKAGGREEVRRPVDCVPTVLIELFYRVTSTPTECAAAVPIPRWRTMQPSQRDPPVQARHHELAARYGHYCDHPGWDGVPTSTRRRRPSTPKAVYGQIWRGKDDYATSTTEPPRRRRKHHPTRSSPRSATTATAHSSCKSSSSSTVRRSLLPSITTGTLHP